MNRSDLCAFIDAKITERVPKGVLESVKFAKRSRISLREIYMIRSARVDPYFSTAVRILNSLGYRLAIVDDATGQLVDPVLGDNEASLNSTLKGES